MEGRHIHRWVLLAWLPVALQDAKVQRGLLASENRGEQEAGQVG